MATITIPTVTIASDFNIDELTTGELDGNGAYDILMKTIKQHLWREYENDRIRGTDYANAYVGLLTNALSQITDYALQKAKQPLELQLLEAQIQKVAADTILVTKQGGLVDAQIYREMAETEKLHLEMKYKLPKELEMMDAQIENMRAEIALKDYELKYLKPMQLEIARQELGLKEYELKYLKPVELDLAKQDLALKEYELKYLKPVQLDLARKDLALKEQQLQIALKELDLKEQQLELAKFELEVKAPAEVRQLNAQADLYAQKVQTEKAQTDPSAIADGSVISYNNKVLAEQARSYDNDGKIKLLSMLIDTWKVRRNDDPDEAPVNDINKLNDVIIGKTVDKTSSSVGFVL